MKSLRLFLIFCVSLSLIPAQFYTGMKSLGGTISYTKNYYNKKETYSTLNIQPTVSYFVQDNVAVGLSLNRMSSTGYGMTQTLSGIGVGFKLYVSTAYMGVAYQTQKWENENDSFNNILGEAGYLFELSQHVYLDFGVDYIKGLDNMEKFETLIVSVGVATFF